jgi:thiamine biosynthesis lipoprotein
MGTDGLVVVVGAVGAVGERLADAAVDRIDDLECRWSRFLPGSELSVLNRAAGEPRSVSGDTLDLIAAALEAWRLTHGWFDPTVLAALLAAGYDRSFAAGRGARVRPPVQACCSGPPSAGSPTPGPVGITIDVVASTVRLPPGVGLDLGGIGKGRACDLVADWLVGQGATGACVDLGGDVAVRGAPDHGDAWVIGVAPGPATEPTRVVRMAAGAVATSTTARRRWHTTEGWSHHLIDPATGRPSTSGVASVTVLAAEAMWAEVLAKAALLAGPIHGPELVAEAGLCGLLATDDGAESVIGDLGVFSSVVSC